jgi:N-acetylglutamate synthase-like GNAT family acetyltransferase
MDSIDIKPGTLTSFTHILPILDTYADAFDFAAKRRIMQLTAKIVEENPKNPSIFLAWHEKNVIGFIGLQMDRDNPDIAEVYGQVVKHGYQGQGVGGKLLQVAIDRVEQSGVGQIRVLIKSSLPTYVRHFYQKAGFKPSFTEDYKGASDESSLMILNLRPQEASSTTAFYPA